MKKLVVFMLCTLIAASLLFAGCSTEAEEKKTDGKTGGEEEKPESLTIITSTDFKAFLEELGKQFEEEEGIKLT